MASKKTKNSLWIHEMKILCLKQFGKYLNGILWVWKCFLWSFVFPNGWGSWRECFASSSRRFLFLKRTEVFEKGLFVYDLSESICQPHWNGFCKAANLLFDSPLLFCILLDLNMETWELKWVNICSINHTQYNFVTRCFDNAFLSSFFSPLNIFLGNVLCRACELNFVAKNQLEFS